MTDDPLTRDEVHDLLRRIFAAFTSPTATPADFAELLTPDYVQRVDGKQLDYAGFVEHHQALRKSIVSGSVSFDHVVTDGASAATVHIAEAVKTTGERIRLKVIAYYEFRGGRISLIDELTHMLEGEQGDRDLGSRTVHG
ncbi:nuclear transport factor 2 family protein [Consotaella aegiceratis]|uniref:nuclear transport factor 2 family protein n=1 Tax=Consotaella aegiceratis TaxID=3097961 RepID=UPI002F40E41A